MQVAGLITFVNDTEEPDLTTLAGRLKWARDRRKLSQAALAKAAKVSQGTIGNLESGARKTARHLLNITGALAISPDWLQSGKGQWDGGGEKGDVFHALNTEEKLLIEHWRNMGSKDRTAKLSEIENLAREHLVLRDELFEEYGINRIAERAAHASRRRTASATVKADSAALKQKSLLPE
jgi:transcriptional regulator with XRE-family HTH domain